MELSGLSDKEFEGILFSRLEGKGCDDPDAELFSETERRSVASGGRMTFDLGLLYHLGVGTEADQDEADRLWVESFPDTREGLEIIANSRYCGSLGLDLRRAGDMYCRASDMGGDDVLMLRAADCYLAEYMEKKDPEAGALAFGADMCNLYEFMTYRYAAADWKRKSYGSTALFASGRPVSTIRLECLRIGSTDIKYLKKLAEVLKQSKSADAKLRGEIEKFLKEAPVRAGITMAHDPKVSAEIREKAIDYIMKLR